jgi:hypothetical protein
MIVNLVYCGLGHSEFGYVRHMNDQAFTRS